MRSGNLRFFLLDMEMREVVDELLSQLDLVVYREPWDRRPLVPLRRSDELTFTAGDRDRPETLVVAAEALSEEVLAEHPRPGTRHGFVSLELPGRDDRTLLLGSVGFKADAGRAADSGRRVFNDVRKSIRTRACLPVLARSWLNGAMGPAAGLFASEKARDLAADGWLLMERGVSNGDYVIADTN